MLQWERRHPWRRLTTSHSKKLGRPRRLSLLSSSSPHGESARERTGLPSNAKGQDIEPPSFEYTQRSKEGAKNDAPSGQDGEPPSFEYTHCSKEGAKNDAPSGQDGEPPSFEYTQRSKEGAKNDAPSKRAATFWVADWERRGAASF